ncbi:MAG: aminoacyl-tRNA hydrolase [Flavobacteriaceae bacterium]|nr:aminoacyl-tRNA hydrolase [Flavobacteriaceae bacterium]
MKKFLIVGLGNIGAEYHKTRHNIGFEVIDFIAEKFEVEMTDLKLGAKGTFNHKGKKIILLKPSTFMNRSGKSVRYWALKENVALENILVITDDLHLPLASLRLKGKGSDGGHNGLKDIESQLNTPNYPRLRFGIKSDEKTFNQVDFVLGRFSDVEMEKVTNVLPQSMEIVLSFIQMGLDRTMNKYNSRLPKAKS